MNDRYVALGGRLVNSVAELLRLWQMKSALAHDAEAQSAEAQSAEARRFGMLVRVKVFLHVLLRELARDGLLPGAGTLTVRVTDDALPVALQEALDRVQPEDLDEDGDAAP